MSDSLTPQIHLHVEQGVNFEHTFQWLAGGVFMAPIEFIEEGYPTIMTVTGHGLNSISAHPVIISGVEGCPHLNSTNLSLPLCSRIDDDKFSVPLTSVGDEWINGKGEITYHLPTDITDFTARMVIRKNWFSNTLIHEMTTENGGIILTVADASIQLLIPKVATAAFNFKHACYDVDLIALGGAEARVFRGPITLHREVSP
jgi:hypothetical protein